MFDTWYVNCEAESNFNGNTYNVEFMVIGFFGQFRCLLP